MTRSEADPVGLLRELIRCPSVAPDAGAALDAVEGHLANAGFTGHRLTFAAPGTQPVDNLFARRGRGAPHLCFACHVDVVPPGDEALWSVPPFAGELRRGRIIGRGAEDMKGAVAAAIAATVGFLAATDRLEGSLSFLVTGDEEGPSVNGTAPVLGWMADNGHTPDHCIVGEPTNRETVGDTIKIGRRGALTGTLTVTGVQGHSAYPERAANPIPAMMRLIEAISPEPDRGNEHFAPSHLEMVSVDVGNPSANVIPSRITARFNARFNDCWTARSLETWLRQRLCEVALDELIGWELTTSSTAEAFIASPGRLVELLQEVITDATGRPALLTTAGGTSDARFIVRHCPVVEFGLVGRSMHQVDEHVPVGELEQLTGIYRAFLERYFAG